VGPDGVIARRSLADHSGVGPGWRHDFISRLSWGFAL